MDAIYIVSESIAIIFVLVAGILTIFSVIKFNQSTEKGLRILARAFLCMVVACFSLLVMNNVNGKIFASVLSGVAMAIYFCLYFLSRKLYKEYSAAK